VQQRNHYTGVVTEYPLVTAYNWFDDHANATFLIRPDGRLIAFYCYHGDNTGIAYRISVNPYDASAWGAQVRFNVGSAGPWGITYPSPVMLSSEGNKVYVFYRDGDSNFSYATSTDMATVAAPASDGAAQTAATWSTLSVVIAKPGDYTIKGVYARITNDGTSRIDIAASYASGPGGPPFVDVRHMYYQSGKWYNSAGAELRLVNGDVECNIHHRCLGYGHRSRDAGACKRLHPVRVCRLEHRRQRHHPIGSRLWQCCCERSHGGSVWGGGSVPPLHVVAPDSDCYGRGAGQPSLVVDLGCRA
jgi:hypothetical protein